MDGRVTIKLIMAEVKYSDDMCTLDKHTQAKGLYTGPGKLAAKLKTAGWNVKDELETVVIGHRGVVSKQNLDAYKNLGIAKGKQEGLQNRLALSAITWLRSIVSLTRRARAKAATVAEAVEGARTVGAGEE